MPSKWLGCPCCLTVKIYPCQRPTTSTSWGKSDSRPSHREQEGRGKDTIGNYEGLYYSTGTGREETRSKMGELLHLRLTTYILRGLISLSCTMWCLPASYHKARERSEERRV